MMRVRWVIADKAEVASALPLVPVLAFVTVLLSAFVSAAVVFLYPRVTERLQTYLLPKRQPLVLNWKNDCVATKSFRLDGANAVVVRNGGRTVLKQNFVPIEDLSTILEVKSAGALDIDLRLEAAHRGNGYSEVIGFGTYVTYQFGKTLSDMNKRTAVFPEGWASGINIRDLRDHYGLNQIVNSMNVARGYYKFCVFSSAHSAISTHNDLAELLVDSKLGRRNVLRFSYVRGSNVQH